VKRSAPAILGLQCIFSTHVKARKSPRTNLPQESPLLTVESVNYSQYASITNDRLIHRSSRDELSTALSQKVLQFLLRRSVNLSRKKSPKEQFSNHCFADVLEKTASLLAFSGQSGNIPIDVPSSDSSSFDRSLCLMSRLCENGLSSTPCLRPSPLSFSHLTPQPNWQTL
jgi:hypothetical protein